MKNRRQKKSQPQKVNLGLEEVTTAPSSFFLSRLPSTHGKPSSTTPIHLADKGMGSPLAAKKARKSNNPTGREGDARGLPTSKGSKRMRVPAITLHNNK